MNRALERDGNMATLKRPERPATFSQASRLVQFINECKPGKDKIQKLLENGVIVKLLLECEDLTMVDLDALRALLMVEPNISWTPVSELTDRIMRRSALRNWGFTQEDADKLTAELHEHYGPLCPTSVMIWLGNLEYSISEMLIWLDDELVTRGCQFTWDFNDKDVCFFAGSEISGERRLVVVDLDLRNTFTRQQYKFMDSFRKERLPGIETVSLLALNPQLLVKMDGEIVPDIIAAGLCVDRYWDMGMGFSFGRSPNKLVTRQINQLRRNVTVVTFRKY